MDTQPVSLGNIEQVVPLDRAILLLVAVAVGALGAVFLMPAWLPGLSASTLGPDPKVYWYLARTSGIVAYLLLWLATILGLLISNKVARVWPGGPLAVELHQFTSLLSIAFTVFHVLILLGDRYIGFTLSQILIPFTSHNYAPFAVGLGQLGLYLILPVTFSFYMRRRIGPATWRSLHYASFLGFAIVAVHGLLAGTDSLAPVLTVFYALTCALVFLLTLYRMLTITLVRA